MITATSGKEALKLFQQNTVDLVIVDHFMPGQQGASVARAMKQLKPDTPIIIFSAYQSLPNEVLGIADLWLRKAETEPDNLLDSVAQLLKRDAPKAANDTPCH